MIRRPPRSTQSRSSAASDVYKRQDEHPHVVPDQLRVGVLVHVRVDLDGARMQATLVRESARTDVRLARERADVRDLGDGVRDPGRLTQPTAGQQAPPVLDLEGRDNAE